MQDFSSPDSYVDWPLDASADFAPNVFAAFSEEEIVTDECLMMDAEQLNHVQLDAETGGRLSDVLQHRPGNFLGSRLCPSNGDSGVSGLALVLRFEKTPHGEVRRQCSASFGSDSDFWHVVLR